MAKVLQYVNKLSKNIFFSSHFSPTYSRASLPQYPAGTSTHLSPKQQAESTKISKQSKKKNTVSKAPIRETKTISKDTT